MNVRRLWLAGLLALTLGLGSTALHAQGYNVFVMGGGSSLFDKNNYTVSTGDFRSTYKNGGQFTVGAEVPLFKFFGLEGSYGYGRNNLAVTDLGTNTETGFNTRNQRLSGDFVVHSPKSFFHLRPYVLAGLEYDRFSPVGNAAAHATSPGFNNVADTALNPANKLGFNYGGGVELKLIRWVGLRFDVRDHLTGSPNYGLPASSSTGGAVFPVSGAAHDLEYSAGVVFHFGK